MDNSKSVVTNEVVPEKVEVIAVDENGRVREISLDYNEYRGGLEPIYRRTTMNNSIISNFSVTGDKCRHTVVEKSKDGKERVLREHTFNYDDSFIENFLIPMALDYSKDNFIYNSKIELFGENQANLAVRTKLNDSLIFLGIRVELANRLKRIIEIKKIEDEDEKKNQAGISNSLVLGLALVVMAILLIVIATVYK